MWGCHPLCPPREGCLFAIFSAEDAVLLNVECRRLTGSTVCSNQARGEVDTRPSPTFEHQPTVSWEVLEEE